MPTTMPTDFESASQMFWSMGEGMLALVGVGIAVVGVALLLWGRILHRGVLVVVAVPIGMWLGGMLAGSIGVIQWQWRLALSASVAVALAILAMVLARLVWASLAGLTLGMVAATLVGWYLLGDLSPASQPAGWEPSAEDLAHAAFAVSGLAMSHTFVGTAVGAFVLGLFLPRVTVIGVTAMLGVSLLVVALMLTAGTFDPSLPLTLAAHQGLFSGAFFALLALGILYQSVRELRARRAMAEKAEPAPEPER